MPRVTLMGFAIPFLETVADPFTRAIFPITSSPWAPNGKKINSIATIRRNQPLRLSRVEFDLGIKLLFSMVTHLYGKGFYFIIFKKPESAT